MLGDPSTKRDHKEATNKEGQPIGKVGHMVVGCGGTTCGTSLHCPKNVIVC